MLFGKKKEKKGQGSGLDDKNAIRFYCGQDVIDELLEDGIDISSIPETAFLLDIIEIPFSLSYTADRKHCSVEICSRSEIGVLDRSKPIAKIDLNRSSSNVSVEATDQLRDQLPVFFAFSVNLAKYAAENDLLKPCEEDSGILLKVKNDEIVAQTVSGRKRPAMMCTTLFGAPQMMRPYMDEVMKKSVIENMDTEAIEGLAEAGDIDMMDHMMTLNMNGSEDMPQDFEKAVYWIRKMAEAGESNGMFNLGLHYAKGCGVERDFGQAVYWMQRALEAGDDDAEEPIETYRKAGEYLRKAEAGDAQAQADYARYLFSSAESLEQAGPDKDYEEAFSWAKKAAAQFNLDGICAMGLAYEHGYGVEEDVEKAFKLYERAAVKGHAPSMTNLGCLYGRGDGVEQDEAKAMEWLEKAAELKDPGALKILHREDPEDLLEGVNMDKLRKKMEAGDVNAVKQYAAACLMGSKYVEEGPERGEELLNDLANQGDTESLRILGMHYRNNSSDGEKLYLDMMLKAIGYYERIGDERYEDGELARELASCYSWMPEQKNSLDTDLAIYWYKVSADLDDEEAGHMVSLLCYVRDNKAKQGIADDADFLQYMVENGKMEESETWSPEIDTSREEHERLFEHFRKQYPV